MITFDNWILKLTTILIIVWIIISLWLKHIYGYWRRVSLAGLASPETTLFLGNIKNIVLQKDSFSSFSMKMYDFFKEKNLPHGGIYFFILPIYYPIDLEIIKNILQNDFSHFVDRGVSIDEQGDPISAHLFSLRGAKWRNLRAKLTPTFTSGKLRMMFDILCKCGEELRQEISKYDHFEAKDFLSRFTIDVIGTCALGIDCNSFKNPNNEFRQHGKRFFVKGAIENFCDILWFIFPDVMKKLRVPIIKKDMSQFFHRIVAETVEYRENNKIQRNDFIQLLIELKNDKCATTITFPELVAQVFVFFLAGFETSATTMTFCLFELASNPDIQEKLREEINSVISKQDGGQIQFHYDAMLEMSYMDQVINETLRKYPPLPTLTRECTKDYNIKIDGGDIPIKKGTKIFIPVLPIHHDEKYYPNPDIFDPERFSKEAKLERHPFAFLPFGEGPRICIGIRFGMMQIKVGLTVLLRNFRFSLNDKTVTPLRMNPKSFILEAQDGVWLNCTPI